MISIAVDITTKLQLLEKQKQLSKQIERAQKMESLGVLAGGIAHDFNNYLMGIIGNNSIAKMDKDITPALLEHLNETEKIAKKAAKLANQMLAYSGRGHFEKKVSNINELIRDMRQLLNVSVSKKVKLHFDLEEGVPSISVDTSQFEQILLNLITNASEAMEDNFGNIHISVYQETLDQNKIDNFYYKFSKITPGEFIVLKVSDTGSGMSDEILRNIFDPFYTTKFVGRGLGLSVVLGIVLGHEGAIKIDTKITEGTTFEMYFPVKHNTEDTIERDEINEVQLDRDEINGRSVILVDDEEYVLSALKGMYEKLGYNIHAFQYPLDALDFYREKYEEISLMVIDLTMVQLSGIELFNKCKEINNDLIALLISGFNEEELIHNFKQHGFADFLKKPFDIDILKSKMGKLNLS